MLSNMLNLMVSLLKTLMLTLPEKEDAKNPLFKLKMSIPDSMMSPETTLNK